MRIFKFISISFLMVYSAGCGCTELGCQDGLNIQINKGADTWAPGKYVFEVNLDGTKSSCTLDLPFVNDPDCLALVQLILTNKDPNSAPAGVVPASVLTNIAATHATLTISLNGAEIARGDFTPTYSIQEPNGERCGPTCHVATDTLAVP